MLAHPVPTKPVRDMGAERVIAVHLKGSWSSGGAPRHLFDVIGQSFAIAMDGMSGVWSSSADLIVEPDVAGFGYDDFKRADDLIRVGEEAMRSALPTVRKWLETPVEESPLATKRGRTPQVSPMPAD
jgi:predicted acylesterase/phospholipase RssA